MAVVTLGTGFPPLLWTGLCLCLCLSLAHSIPPTGSSQPLEQMHNARPHGGLLTLQRMRGHPEGQGLGPRCYSLIVMDIYREHTVHQAQH